MLIAFIHFNGKSFQNIEMQLNIADNIKNKNMNFKRIIVIIIISNLLYINTANIRNFILSITSIISLIIPKIALGSTELEINKIAGEITVRIDGQNRGGSGVIVEKQGNTYYVLTNWRKIRFINS